MWRHESVHERGEAEPLEDALRRAETPARLARADAFLERAARAEPLFRDMLKTPQSPPYHAEGPHVRDHLRLALAGFFALTDGELHLIDIEEFRRMKGYEGEIDEIEEILKERAAFFETFILCHDAGKWATVSFEGSPAQHHWADEGHAANARRRAEYLALSPEERAGIRVHYVGHAKMVHAPAYRDVLRREAARRALPDRDVELLEDVIAHHMDPVADFADAPRAARIARYARFAETRGYDPDDYLDDLQAAVLLDGVFGTRPLTDGRPRVHADLFLNFLRAEHDWAPHRRAEKEARREAARERERARAFREAGLDGVALMDLLGREPGPEFGATLRAIQTAVRENTPLPRFGGSVDAELARRAARFYEALYPVGV